MVFDRERVLSIAEAQEFALESRGARVPTLAVRAMIHTGRLPAMKGYDGQWRFRLCDFCGAFLSVFQAWHRLKPPTKIPPKRLGDRLHTPETAADLQADLVGEERAPTADEYRAWIASGELSSVIDEHGREVFHFCDACDLHLRMYRQA